MGNFDRKLDTFYRAFFDGNGYKTVIEGFAEHYFHCSSGSHESGNLIDRHFNCNGTCFAEI